MRMRFLTFWLTAYRQDCALGYTHRAAFSWRQVQKYLQHREYHA
jgi:hypothetical protein